MLLDFHHYFLYSYIPLTFFFFHILRILEFLMQLIDVFPINIQIFLYGLSIVEAMLNNIIAAYKNLFILLLLKRLSYSSFLISCLL